MKDGDGAVRAREAQREERFLEELRDGDDAGRDVIPVYSSPVGTGAIVMLPSVDPTRVVVQAFEACGFRAPPGMDPVLYVGNFVICARSEEAGIGAGSGLTGGAVLPASSR